ncbi:hypothetical protein SNEBB_006854 [Seison nebaliae]|nr:hypothetical protein SNEBB_006854 [Seison nebaliae]
MSSAVSLLPWRSVSILLHFILLCLQIDRIVTFGFNPEDKNYVIVSLTFVLLEIVCLFTISISSIFVNSQMILSSILHSLAAFLLIFDGIGVWNIRMDLLMGFTTVLPVITETIVFLFVGLIQKIYYTNSLIK